MSKLCLYLTVVAWPVAVVSTVLLMAALLGHWLYHGDKVLQVHDTLNHVRRTYPKLRYAIPALVAWAWIVTEWLS